jgi:ABC-type microcin C transport system permease subunit YejB
MLCEYKNMLGKVGEGVHSIRIFNVAIVDVLLTIIGAYIIHFFAPGYRFSIILLILFATGIALHWLFCVRTTVDKLLFRQA